MGLTIKNHTSHELGNNLTEFFSIPIDTDEVVEDEYRRLKDEIFLLDIDPEEKANVINKINSLNVSKSSSEKKKIEKEIEEFRNTYNI